MHELDLGDSGTTLKGSHTHIYMCLLDKLIRIVYTHGGSRSCMWDPHACIMHGVRQSVESSTDTIIYKMHARHRVPLHSDKHVSFISAIDGRGTIVSE